MAKPHRPVSVPLVSALLLAAVLVLLAGIACDRLAEGAPAVELRTDCRHLTSTAERLDCLEYRLDLLSQCYRISAETVCEGEPLRCDLRLTCSIGAEP